MIVTKTDIVEILKCLFAGVVTLAIFGAFMTIPYVTFTILAIIMGALFLAIVVMLGFFVRVIISEFYK